MRKINKHIVTWSLASINISLVCVYLLLVGTSVWNVVDRQEAERNIKKMTTEVSLLEATYMSFNSEINIENATLLGFKNTPPENTIFVKQSTTLGMR